jgi:conjugal transfer/entry exclusion protein
MVNVIELNNIIKQFQTDLSTINNTLANIQDMDAKKKKEILKMMGMLNKIITILHAYKDLLSID